MGSPPKNVESPAQDMVMSEPQIFMNSMEATSEDTLQPLKGGESVPTTAIGSETTAERLSDNGDFMDLVDFDDKVKMNPTSPLRSAPPAPPTRPRTQIPTSALAPAPTPTAKPARKSGLKSTYKKETYVDKSTKRLFQQVEQRNMQQPDLQQARDVHSLQGPTEAANYSFGDVGRTNKLRPIYAAPALPVAPQNPFPIALGQGSGVQGPCYSQFETQQASQRPRKHSAHYDMNTCFLPQIQGPMPPQYPAQSFGSNAGQTTNGHAAVSSANASSYVHIRVGSHLRGRGNERRGKIGRAHV